MKRPDQEAERWLSQAEDDFRFVEWVGKEGVFFDKGCFIAQQAGEKALKACIYATGKRHVLGHSLYEMVMELAQQDALFKMVEDESALSDLAAVFHACRFSCQNSMP